jgi:alpha-L-rhamnosidase
MISPKDLLTRLQACIHIRAGGSSRFRCFSPKSGDMNGFLKLRRKVSTSVAEATILKSAIGIFLSLIGFASHLHAEVRVENLRCEYRENPLGVDVPKPRLSWILESEIRGERQTAYQILVASSAQNLSLSKWDLWDSGKVISDETCSIECGGSAHISRQQCFWKVRIWNQENQVSAWSTPAFWSTGLLKPSDWEAKWIGLDEQPALGPDQTATPRYLRKDFIVAQKMRRATIYATALGLYELRLNRQRIGDALLTPEWTDYRKRIQYQTYDVTPLVHEGANAFGAILGNGWYCGHWQMWKDKLQTIYGSQPFLKAQLEIEYADGSRQVVGSDGSWRGTTDGPLRSSGIYEGETYDARKEMPGWDAAGFDQKSWEAITVSNPQAGELVWQRSEPICVTEELRPVSIKEPKPGVFVFDLGQNMAGWCKLHLNEPASTMVTLKFNEMLNPDGTVYMDNLHAGHLSHGDRQMIRYTCRGGGEVFETHFTYQGFRYVEVTGLSSPPEKDLLVGRVFHNSFQRVGAFTCSNKLLNRLALNIQWSQRANMMGVPTDCCQRDERCGYTGDMNFFMPTAIYNFDVAAFFSKWLVDVCEDSQMPDGHFADHAPTFGPGNGWNVGWSDAGIICPWVYWQTYGDTRMIREHYPAMQRFLSLLKNTSKDDLHGGRVGNGDWLNLSGGADKVVIGTAYDAFDFQLMADMAQAIGKEQDAADYRERAAKIKEAFARAFIDADGRIKNSSQTGYALAFTMGLVPQELKSKMTERFVEEIQKHDWHLATGFIGTPRLLPALHLAGRDDIAYKLLLNETYPSWLYQVKLGATTMWERWNGWTPEKGFAGEGMNSFNHYAFGSVGQYLYSSVGGIQSGGPGYKIIRIEPTIGEGLTWAKASYDSIHGRIVSDWKLQEGKLLLDVTIPANTTATISIPAASIQSVTESGTPITKDRGITLVKMDGDRVIISVVSGVYHVTSILK